MDVRMERIPLLWNIVGETALAKGFYSNMRNTKELQKNVIINLDWLIVGCACQFSCIHVCGQHMDILHTNICMYIHTYI